VGGKRKGRRGGGKGRREEKDQRGVKRKRELMARVGEGKMCNAEKDRWSERWGKMMMGHPIRDPREENTNQVSVV